MKKNKVKEIKNKKGDKFPIEELDENNKNWVKIALKKFKNKKFKKYDE